MKKQWELTIPEELMRQIETHLFPGDGDEHGGVIAAGISKTERGVRLLAREFFPAVDGVDFVPGEHSYRRMTATFVRDKILYCRDERLAYLSVHCHGGDSHVGFSPDDLASHRRGYPALLDIARGQVVGALVFARNALAGEIWLPEGGKVSLTRGRVVGDRIRWLYSAPPPRPPHRDDMYDRQARIFGDRGQALLASLKVGVIGAGGAGSLLIEYLARLGVGHLISADPDHVETSNIPRVVGSTLWDALPWFTDDRRPAWLRRIGLWLATKKVRVAERVVRAANPKALFEGIIGSIVDDDVARRFVDCDYIFCAADSMQARLIFNAIVHQYLIPGTQVGAKVTTDLDTGDILDVFSACRPISPDNGCLWCNQLIVPARLQEEALPEHERRAQRYVDEPDVAAPSVITLNAVASALAANDFLFRVTGLLSPVATPTYLRYLSRRRELFQDEPRRDFGCTECGKGDRSRKARGDSWSLPTRRKP